MDIEKIKRDLSEIGNIEVVKAGIVFTILLTGDNLTSTDVFFKIGEITREIKSEYPLVEVIKNDEHFYLMILKK